MKKRFLSIVLAVLMLLSVLPTTVIAADRTTVNTAQNGIEATKTAKWVNEKEGIAEITITVKGEPPEVSTPEVDAVLVIDLSGCDVTRSVSKTTEIERRGGKRWDKPKKAEKSRDCGGGKF